MSLKYGKWRAGLCDIVCNTMPDTFTDDLKLSKDYTMLSIEAFFLSIRWDDLGASKKEFQQVSHHYPY